MALYDYLCPVCRKGFELMRPMSDAHRPAACPACGSEAQRVISGGSSVEGLTHSPVGNSMNDLETRTPASEARAVNQQVGLTPAFDLERGTGQQGGPSDIGLREDIDLGRSVGSATVVTSKVVREEGSAVDSGLDLQEDTTPLEMPWLIESQPGGGNLWYIRDWGIASMFGYLRMKQASEVLGEMPSLAAGTDVRPAVADGYPQITVENGAALVEPESATGPAEGAGSQPTFSEWRTAISIMPWLQDTGIGSSEDYRDIHDVVSEDADMPGLRPRRDRRAVHLEWAGWLHSQPAGERTVDIAERRSRPAKEAKEAAADFPAQVIDGAWRRQGGRCAGCGRWLIWPLRGRDCGTGAWESHHRVPIDQGGSSLLSNCVLFCSGVSDCHFNIGHGGIGWTHYPPLDESALLFLFAGLTTATVPVTPVRHKRSLLREVFGVAQVGKDRGKPRDGSSGRGSTV